MNDDAKRGKKTHLPFSIFAIARELLRLEQTFFYFPDENGRLKLLIETTFGFEMDRIFYSIFSPVLYAICYKK